MILFTTNYIAHIGLEFLRRGLKPTYRDYNNFIELLDKDEYQWWLQKRQFNSPLSD